MLENWGQNPLIKLHSINQREICRAPLYETSRSANSSQWYARSKSTLLSRFLNVLVSVMWWRSEGRVFQLWQKKGEQILIWICKHYKASCELRQQEDSGCRNEECRSIYEASLSHIRWCHCNPKPHHLLPHINSDWFYIAGTGIPRLSWKKSVKQVVPVVFHVSVNFAYKSPKHRRANKAK